MVRRRKYIVGAGQKGEFLKQCPRVHEGGWDLMNHTCGEFAAAATNSLQSCPTLSDHMDWSLPGIFQARVPEWGAIAFSE